MRLCLQLFFLIAATCLASGAQAQTLTEKLIAEDPAVLAQSALKDGNIVRGAILFHQGNINCAKCHRPNAEMDRIGPDLSRIDRDATDAYLVESILQPSKTIKKGFETATVVTLDGKLLSGLVVEQDAEKIVLRDNANVDELLTIAKNDIEEMRPGTKSSMPDALVNELKNRQQFLDLVRYVIDVRQRGPTADVAPDRPIVRRELSPELNGLVLINQLNCVACHQPESTPSLLAPKQAPNLKWSGKWLNPDYLARFIAQPHAVKPGTTMPGLLQQLDEPTRTQTAEAITHFLVSQSGNQFQTHPVDLQSASRGSELFHSVGCVACHSPRDQTAMETPIPDSVPLGDVSQKYSTDGLVAFLENPHVVRASGRMPSMRLTHFEAQDIANFLLQSTNQPETTWEADAALAQKGKQLFTEFNCTACHTGVADLKPKPPSQPALAQLKPDQGCLSGKPGNWPDFHLDDRDRNSIWAAVKNLPSQLTNEQQISVSLQSFNCIACHQRGDLGGVTAIRNPHFQTENLNLGEQGRIPPTLSSVGAKLNPKWMRDVLVNGRSIRPYMKTRMPQYGEENIGHLIELFQTTDKLPETEFAEFDDQKEMRKLGLTIAGNKGLNCVACHTYQYKLSDTMPAVDLTEMTERLKKDWFYQYMLAPQKFSPNTVMPSFWPGGKAIRQDIVGDPEFQIEALWQYLIDGRQASAPSGVVREPLEIVVTNEAQMLRRSYPGIGKRGIGVGYPGGVNLAFDAEQMRLAMVWKGKFADPAGVWTGQGHGNVRPMERPFDFAKGPDLDDQSRPWVVDDSRPPNHHFLGYELDELRRPTFKYRFEDVEVSDFFSQVDDGDLTIGLSRQVVLSSTINRDSLRFRVVTGKEISAEGNGLFAIGKELKVRILSDHDAQIVDDTDGKQLRIGIELAAGKPQNLMIEYLWK
jgi:putative heme-binding domain-containing protein